MKKTFLYIFVIFLIFEKILGQRLVTESNKFDKLRNEYKSIYNHKISQETRITEISNGDVIQALAMALAVRMKMVSANEKIVEKIVIERVAKALLAAKKADIKLISAGNA